MEALSAGLINEEGDFLEPHCSSMQLPLSEMLTIIYWSHGTLFFLKELDRCERSTWINRVLQTVLTPNGCCQ